MTAANKCTTLSHVLLSYVLIAFAVLHRAPEINLIAVNVRITTPHLAELFQKFLMYCGKSALVC